MDVALKIMALDAGDKNYIFALLKIFVGYMGSSTKDIMNHLMYWYGIITVEDIDTKKNLLQEPLYMSQKSMSSSISSMT